MPAIGVGSQPGWHCGGGGGGGMSGPQRRPVQVCPGGQQTPTIGAFVQPGGHPGSRGTHSVVVGGGPADFGTPAIGTDLVS
jgi:hypothetical protein